MDVAGLSHEHGAGSSATHRSANTRDRRGRRSGTAVVRAEPSRATAVLTAAAPDTADQLQADYFVRLLTGRRGLIDQRIGEYQRKIATAEKKRDVDAMSHFRHLVRTAEQDRQTVEVLLEKLCRRFARWAPADSLAASARGKTR